MKANHEPASTELLAKPVRQREESPLSFLVRTAEENGYPDYRWLFQLVGGTGRGKSLLLDHRSQVAALLGEEADRLLQLRKVNDRGETETQVKCGDAWMPLGYLEHRGPRVCPECLRQYGFRHLLWDLKAFTCCPVHAVRLLEACPECKAPPMVNANGQFACVCGADFRDARAELATAPEVALHQWLAYLASFGPLPASRCYKPLAQELSRLAAGELIDLVLVLGWGRAVYDPLRTLPRKAASEWTKTITEGAELLAEWPENLVTAACKNDSIRYDAFLGHREANQHLYRALSGKLRGEQFGFVSEVLVKLEEEAWQSFRPRLQLHLPEPVAAREAAPVGAKSLGTELGLQEDAVIQLARAGVVPSITETSSRGRLNWFFEPDTGQRIYDDMERHAKPAPEGGFTYALPLFKARQLASDLRPLPWLVQSAMSGKVPLVARMERGRGRGLNACFFDHKCLLLEDHSYLQEGKEEISAHSIGYLLGLKDEAGAWLIERGRLRRALEEPVGSTLTVEQFWRLFNAIVVPGHVIFGAKTGVRPGKRGLDQIKAVPFATSKNGSPAVLYWRWDVERKLEAYMAKEQ